MRRARYARILRPTPSPATFIFTLQLILAGCAAERVTTQRGESGPIAWEVTDIRQSLEERGNRMRWDYTLVLRNIGSTTITLDQVTLISMTRAGNLSGGYSSQPYFRILKPGAEIREPNNSYSHGCSQTCDPGWVRQMLRDGVTRSIEFRGRDEAGRPVTSTLRLRLDSSVGLGPSSSGGMPAE